jgi:hypothetical protein
MAYPVIGRCPICDQVLEVTRLYCRHCDSSVEGHFSLGRFHRLTPRQLDFVETFVRCEGKINRVEEELDVSYPTVRNRLREVIHALGYEVRDEAEQDAARLSVLERLASGEINSDEAVTMIRALS